MGAFDQPANRVTAEDVQSPADFSAGIHQMRQQGYAAGDVRETAFVTGNPNPSAGHLPPVELAGLSGDQSGALASKMNDASRNSFYTGDQNAPNQMFFEKLGSNSSASAWDMGEVLESTLSSANLAGGASTPHELDQDLTVMGHYWDQISNPSGYDSQYGPNGDKYYDDNSWIGIALVDAYKQNHRGGELDGAKEVFKFQQFGAQGTEKLTHPGGVFWTQQPGNFYRATVSTAGAAQVALELYQQTQDPTEKQQYLQFAQQQFDWVNENLRGPNGLYYDGMDPDGSTATHQQQFTYNSGLMLGDATMLYQATGDSKYLQQAQDIAKASLQNFSDQIPGGPSPFSQQLPFFNAVFFKNLMKLDAVAPDASYRQALADYSAQLAQKVDAQTGLITTQDDDHKDQQKLLDQSSAVQIFSLAAENPAS